MKRLVIALAALFLAGPAHAQTIDLFRPTAGYVYFSRPGADLATHDAELKNCAATWFNGYAGEVSPVDPSANVPITKSVSPLSHPFGLVGSMVQTQMLSGWERARYHLNIEHCMVARGWRVVRIPREEGAELAKLPREALAERLSTWVGASQPHGEIVRVWGNEIGRGDIKLYADAKAADRTLLSAFAADPGAGEPLRSVVAAPGVAFSLPSKFPKALLPEDLGSIPPDAVLVIIRMTGDSSRTPSLRFEKVPDQFDPKHPWSEPFVAVFHRPKTVNGRREKILMFPISPGKWRVWGATSTFDLCTGSPSFEARPGDVLFLGSFEYGSEPVSPSMALESAQALLAGRPDLAGRLRPAHWVNGSTSPCRNWHPYALEFAGFPFEDGYAWGSRAPR